MKDWKHSTQQEIDNMTFDEAVEIVQKQIDMGEKKVGESGQWCARAHTTHAYQMVLHRAIKANEGKNDLIKALKENVEMFHKMNAIHGFLCEAINEIQKPHYDREDDLNSYYKICSIIKNANEYLEKKGD